MSSSNYKVCVVTVTYGNRWQFLTQVLTRILQCKAVSHVVVVDNASGYNVANEINSLNESRIELVISPTNTGSAGGYKMGLQNAVAKTDADFFLLLDDDNLPDEQAITGLLNAWDQIDGPDNRKALFCLRTDRRQHVKIAQGENPYRYYLVADNFLGFNVFRIFNNQFYKLRDKFNAQKTLKHHAQIPYVPYGGLLIHRSTIADIGFPDERMYLYVDDSEYTYRITKAGGAIWLVPSCTITDVDQSQGIGYKKQLFHSHLLDQWSFRSYYHIRNRMFFYGREAVKNPLIFKFNKFLYLSYLKISGIITGKQHEYHKVVQAVNDGLQGKLGQADTIKF